jgi:hypothetical protein
MKRKDFEQLLLQLSGEDFERTESQEMTVGAKEAGTASPPRHA